MNDTTFATSADHQRAMSTWHLVDASEHVLGRMAVAIATVLMGKHKPLYTPHINVGEGVVVINAEKVNVTGNKREGRTYRHYSGYPGGLKKKTLGDYLNQKPEELIKLAVRRMLPKTRMGRQMLKRLKVYRGPEHRHGAQKPQRLAMGSRPPSDTGREA